jgi:hypothetical protein
MSLLGSDTFYYSGTKKVYLSPVEKSTLRTKSTSKDKLEANYYKTQDNYLLGVADKIIVKFKNLDDLQKISKEFNLQLIKNIYANVYLFKVDNISKTIDTANKLYLLDSVEYAHPNFIREVKIR